MRLSKRERFLLAVLTLLLLWTGFINSGSSRKQICCLPTYRRSTGWKNRSNRAVPGKQNLEQTAEKLEQAGNGQIYFADMSPEKWTESFCSLQEKLGYNFPEWKQGNKRDGYSRLCVYTSYTGICVYRQGTGSRICGKDQPGRRRYVDKVVAVRKR